MGQRIDVFYAFCSYVQIGNLWYNIYRMLHNIIKTADAPTSTVKHNRRITPQRGSAQRKIDRAPQLKGGLFFLSLLKLGVFNEKWTKVKILKANERKILMIDVGTKYFPARQIAFRPV